MKIKRVFTLIAWLFVAFIAVVSCHQAATNTPSPSSTAQATKPATITVSAAASMQDALKAIASVYSQQQQNVTIKYNFASSGALQQQIEQGAPVDVFISASLKQMDALQKENLLLAGTQKNLLKNTIVLITPKDATGISDFKDLTSNRVSKIAIGAPKSVPAGQYAQQVLTSLKLFNQLQSKLVLASNVRQVLSYVETGNVSAGVVYSTDAKTSDKVKVVITAPENTHFPIIYPLAVLKGSKNPEVAKKFIQFLSSEPATAVFEKYGFGISQ